MAFCKNCGTQLPDEGVFCAVCGTPVEKQQAAPVQGQPVPPQYPVPQYQQPIPQYQPMPVIDPADHTADYDAADIAENKVIAMAIYLFGPIGIILGLLAAHDSKYVGFHVRQALKLNIAMTLTLVLCIIPFLGWFAAGIIDIILAVVTIICFVDVCKGKVKDAPFISKIKFLN